LSIKNEMAEEIKTGCEGEICKSGDSDEGSGIERV